MTKILILVCALSTPAEDCSPRTAVSSSGGPNVPNAIMCGLWGQSQIAQTAIGPHGDEYEKIVCSTGGGSKVERAAND